MNWDINFIFSLPAYHMAVVNVVLLAALGIEIWLLKIKPGVAIILISILPIISIFRSGDYNGGLYQNSAFAMGFYNSIKDGNVIPRWAERMDTWYGYPAFIFLYPLPYYLTSIFHFLGFNYVNSVKLVLVFSYVVAGVAMYKWAREEFEPKVALLAGVLYQFAPYRFIDLHHRLDLGENVSFVFAPLVFLAIKRNKSVLGALSMASLILSHPAMSVAFGYLLGFYFIYLNWGRSFRILIRNTFPVILGVILSAYYWFPVFWETNQVHIQAWTNGVYIQGIKFLTIGQLVYSPWRWGLLFQGMNGEMVPILGYVHMAILAIGLWMVFVRRKVLTNNLYFWLVACGVCFLLFIPISKPLWYAIPFLKNFQFSFRLLGSAAFLTAMVGGYAVREVLNSDKQRVMIIVLIAAVIGITILNWGNRESNTAGMTDREIAELLPIGSRLYSTGFPQAVPIWVDIKNYWGQIKEIEPIESVDGKAEIKQVFRNSTEHKYRIKALTGTRLMENTYYYPGWKLTVDGKEQAIDYQDKDYPGVMHFNLEPGEHTVKLRFGNTWDRSASLAISGLTGIYLLTRAVTIATAGKSA